MTAAERVAAAVAALRAGYSGLRALRGIARQRRESELEEARQRLVELVGLAYRMGELSDAEYDAALGVVAA